MIKKGKKIFSKDKLSGLHDNTLLAKDLNKRGYSIKSFKGDNL